VEPVLANEFLDHVHGLAGWTAARAQRSGARARTRSRPCWSLAVDCHYEHEHG
jgi:hypothetical protein